MTTLICPKCRSTNLRRSRVRGIGEKAQYVFRRKPFRCKDCDWRGMMFTRGYDGKNAAKKKAYLFAALFSIAILVLLAIFNLRPDLIENLLRTILGTAK